MSFITNVLLFEKISYTLLACVLEPLREIQHSLIH